MPVGFGSRGVDGGSVWCWAVEMLSFVVLVVVLVLSVLMRVSIELGVDVC